ncbi:ras-related and estrogen-regulated growth inhibitor-like protein [Arctopsyche grandis]|uniref:ras-related and estrogen-regulated growth inhibitor-like protein n=1 Tax=Arctopsyche grandis TaxID=121162 RepID=UPI00406D9318
MNTTSPKSSLAKLGLGARPKPIKVMVLGQGGVGKTAMVVRFITRRFIGEYDPSLEKVYAFHTVMDDEMVYFDILDTAGQPHESECLTLEANIRWAEAFILVYSVTDKCSFDECNRLKFLINYNKRRRRLGSNSGKESALDVPVVLVGNKTDQGGDRMVSVEEGQRRSKEIGCVCFHEISVRESIEQVWSVFRDVCRFWRVHAKCPRLKRSGSETPGEAGASPEPTPPSLTSLNGSLSLPCHHSSRSAISPILLMGRRWTEVELEEEDEKSEGSSSVDGTASNGPCGCTSPEAAVPFRGRASTDGHLSRPRRWRFPPPAAACGYPPTADRRMSISMRGNNASY